MFDRIGRGNPSTLVREWISAVQQQQYQWRREAWRGNSTQWSGTDAAAARYVKLTKGLAVLLSLVAADSVTIEQRTQAWNATSCTRHGCASGDRTGTWKVVEFDECLAIELRTWVRNRRTDVNGSTAQILIGPCLCVIELKTKLYIVTVLFKGQTIWQTLYCY